MIPALLATGAEPLQLLLDLAIMFAVALPVTVLLQRLRQSPIVGYLITGVVIGPHVLGWIGEGGEIPAIANVGVILLMFSIGLHVSMEQLWRIRRVALQGGAIQVIVTAAVVTLAMHWLGDMPLGRALVVGCAVSLSSTALVLKYLADHGRLDAPVGRCSLGILLFQDLVVGLMLTLVTVVHGAGGGDGFLSLHSLWLALRAVAVLSGLLLAGRWLVAPVLNLAAQARHNELFMLAVILVALATGAAAYWAGLSIAFGAFMAGLMISRTPFWAQATSLTAPLRDVLGVVFFVSIGLLLDPLFIWHNPGLVALAIIGVLLIKALLVAGAVRVSGVGWPVAIVTGLYLGQIGEFSFVVVLHAYSLDVVSERAYQLIIAAAVITLVVSPMLFELAPRMARLVGFERRRVELSLKALGPGARQSLAGGVLICGFGVVGRHVYRVLQAAGVRCRVLEMNADTVARLQADRVPAVYGDATNEEVLALAGAAEAAAVVITLPDVASQLSATRAARAVCGRTVLTRVAFDSHADAVRAAGADEVIGQETSAAEAFEHVLAPLLGVSLHPTDKSE